jgi:hypothetical protein
MCDALTGRRKMVWRTLHGGPTAVALEGKAHESAVQGSCRPAVGMFAAFMGLAAAHQDVSQRMEAWSLLHRGNSTAQAHPTIIVRRGRPSQTGLGGR